MHNTKVDKKTKNNSKTVAFSYFICIFAMLIVELPCERFIVAKKYINHSVAELRINTFVGAN